MASAESRARAVRMRLALRRGDIVSSHPPGQDVNRVVRRIVSVLATLSLLILFPAAPDAAGSTPVRLVRDIAPGHQGSRIGSMVDIEGTLYFGADDGTHGNELWKSDGTRAGTVMVKDINPGSDASSPTPPVEVGGVLYFSADDGTHGYELWKSDGTGAGTVDGEGHRSGTGFVRSGAAHEPRWDLVLRGHAEVFGRATGPRPEPRWSRTTSRPRSSSVSKDACSSPPSTHAGEGAVDERRNRSRDRHGQGHPSRRASRPTPPTSPRSRAPSTSRPEVRSAPAELWRTRWNRGRNGHGEGHQPDAKGDGLPR